MIVFFYVTTPQKADVMFKFLPNFLSSGTSLDKEKFKMS